MDPVTFRVDPAAVARAITPNTIGLVVSAPCFPQGVIDPVEAVAAIPGIEELNIGHTIVARALAVGLEQAVRQMKQLVSQPRREPLFGAGALLQNPGNPAEALEPLA